MGRPVTSHVAKRPRLRWLLLTPLLALGVMGAPRAEINHVICLKVYYTINDGPPQYIHDRCYFPVSYPDQDNGNGCTPLGSIEVCREWSTAYPDI